MPDAYAHWRGRSEDDHANTPAYRCLDCTFAPSDDNAIRGEYYLLEGPSADERRTPAVVTEIVVFRTEEITFGYAITAWDREACRWATAKYVGAGGLAVGE